MLRGGEASRDRLAPPVLRAEGAPLAGPRCGGVLPAQARRAALAPAQPRRGGGPPADPRRAAMLFRASVLRSGSGLDSDQNLVLVLVSVLVFSSSPSLV